MEEYKKKVKKSIEEYISKSYLEEAKEIIKEYEKLVKDDIDVYSFKGVISMLEGNFEEAEKILNEGNDKYQNSFDICYNLGYLYKSIGNFEFAIKYYIESLINSTNENEETAAYDELLSLDIKEKKNNIIAQKYYKDAKKYEAIGDKSDAALYYGLSYKYSKDKTCEFYEDNNKLKNIFNAAISSQKKRFIILSSCEWSHIYQRMHHISRSLAKFGNEVIYITPGELKDFNNEEISLDDLIQYSINNRRVVDGVKIYSPILASYNGTAISNNYSYLVQSLLNSSTEAYKTIIVTYMPYQVDTIKKLVGEFIHIYDCVDDHCDLEYAFWGNAKDVVWEQELMDRADAITTTATSLYLQRTLAEGRKNVYLSRNAVIQGDFIVGDQEIPEELKNIPEPRIVYTGVVYSRYDEKLFYEVVDSNPDKSFIIIGPIIGDMLKDKRDNLYLLGAKKHSELKNYLKYMQIGIVPYIDTADMDIACDSIKQYEYIACGLTVITTYMPESAMNKIYTFLANTKEEFNEAIKKCLELEVDKNVVNDFISENSWNARAALLCNIADNNITDLEKNILIKNMENEIVKACLKYDSPIFETIKAMCLNLQDVRKVEKSIADIYNKFNNKYIEKQYLMALLNNKKTIKFIEIVANSSYIREEVKGELLYCKKTNNLSAVECISYICVGNLREALRCIEKIENTYIKLIYNVYLNYILGEKIILGKLNAINSKNQESPLFKFLYKIVRMQEILISL